MATYMVSSAGNDINDGVTLPVRTFQKAVSLATSSGDIIQLESDETHFVDYYNFPPTLAANNITITSSGPSRAKLKNTSGLILNSDEWFADGGYCPDPEFKFYGVDNPDGSTEGNFPSDDILTYYSEIYPSNVADTLLTADVPAAHPLGYTRCLRVYRGSAVTTFGLVFSANYDFTNTTYFPNGQLLEVSYWIYNSAGTPNCSFEVYSSTSRLTDTKTNGMYETYTTGSGTSTITDLSQTTSTSGTWVQKTAIFKGNPNAASGMRFRLNFNGSAIGTTFYITGYTIKPLFSQVSPSCWSIGFDPRIAPIATLVVGDSIKEGSDISILSATVDAPTEIELARNHSLLPGDSCYISGCSGGTWVNTKDPSTLNSPAALPISSVSDSGGLLITLTLGGESDHDMQTGDTIFLTGLGNTSEFTDLPNTDPDHVHIDPNNKIYTVTRTGVNTITIPGVYCNGSTPVYTNAIVQRLYTVSSAEPLTLKFKNAEVELSSGTPTFGTLTKYTQRNSVRVVNHSTVGRTIFLDISSDPNTTPIEISGVGYGGTNYMLDLNSHTGLTVSNIDYYGGGEYGIIADTDDFTLQNCGIYNCGRGLNLISDSPLVTDCTFKHLANYAAKFTGNNVTFTNNVVEDVIDYTEEGGAVWWTSSNNHIVTDNSITNCDKYGIAWQGQALTITNIALVSGTIYKFRYSDQVVHPSAGDIVRIVSVTETNNKSYQILWVGMDGIFTVFTIDTGEAISTSTTNCYASTTGNGTHDNIIARNIISNCKVGIWDQSETAGSWDNLVYNNLVVNGEDRAGWNLYSGASLTSASGTSVGINIHRKYNTTEFWNNTIADVDYGVAFTIAPDSYSFYNNIFYNIYSKYTTATGSIDSTSFAGLTFDYNDYYSTYPATWLYDNTGTVEDTLVFANLQADSKELNGYNEDPLLDNNYIPNSAPLLGLNGKELYDVYGIPGNNRTLGAIWKRPEISRNRRVF